VSVIDEAIVALRMGKLVVVPTDTVYGLAAPLEDDSIAKIFELKGRPSEKPLPVLGASLPDLEDIADFNDQARKLAARFWPGPLTMILQRAPSFDVDLGGTNVTTVGVRVPKEPRAIELLKRTGPLAVTSANLSGSTEATTVEEARAALGTRDVFYVDGGRCTGKPSTIVFLAAERRILREGAINDEDIFRTMQ
jgi:tRNA threonylcarbamoyl adenosine modification protein (Sua5/YciO/YrdC/YwlC family)